MKNNMMSFESGKKYISEKKTKDKMAHFGK